MKRELSVIDLFCGCGGLSLGFKMAGFKLFGGVDFAEAAMNTHRNYFHTPFEYCGDIAEISDDFIKNKLSNKVDVIIGGPPCQGFSGLNMRKDEKNDPRNKLFLQFLRFVEIIKPKALVIENVKQILTSNNGAVKEEILKVLKELGYNVSFSILDASDFGVPQSRRRAIFVGIRKDIGSFEFDSLTKYMLPKTTVFDAISDIAEIEEYVIKNPDEPFYELGKPKTNLQKELRKRSESKLFNHLMYYPTRHVQTMISYVKQGENWTSVPRHLFKSDRDNRQSNYLKRLEYDKPSITIDTGHNMYFHPVFNRVPTIRESARLQSFPDDFIFYGNKGEQFRQVGNAVPPLLAKAIANGIMEVLRDE